MADSTTLEPPALQETSSAIQPPPSTEAQNSVANMVDTSENNVGEQDTTMTGGQADSTKLEKLAETNSVGFHIKDNSCSPYATLPVVCLLPLCPSFCSGHTKTLQPSLAVLTVCWQHHL